MTNPYKASEEIIPETDSKSRPLYSYFVAAFGSLIVFVGAFMGIVMVPVVAFPVIYESAVGLVLMYVIGILLAIVASVLSFRATLRAYSKN
jgi:hypothetical protein